jgi:hypothetical protein
MQKNSSQSKPQNPPGANAPGGFCRKGWHSGEYYDKAILINSDWQNKVVQFTQTDRTFFRMVLPVAVLMAIIFALREKTSPLFDRMVYRRSGTVRLEYSGSSDVCRTNREK